MYNYKLKSDGIFCKLASDREKSSDRVKVVTKREGASDRTPISKKKVYLISKRIFLASFVDINQRKAFQGQINTTRNPEFQFRIESLKYILLKEVQQKQFLM